MIFDEYDPYVHDRDPDEPPEEDEDALSYFDATTGEFFDA